MRSRLVPGLLLIFAVHAAAGDTMLRIPPVSASLDVKGQPVKITLWGAVSQAAPDIFHLAVTADLADFADHLTPLLAAQLNRSDNCGERMSVEHAAIAPARPVAMLTVNVHYERWACAKVFGKERTKRLVGGNGVVVVKLTPSVGADGIAMQADVQKIDADGSLGELLHSDSFGSAIKEKIAASIQSAVRKSLDLHSALPPAIGSTAVIRGVEFAQSPEGRLWITLSGDVHLSAAQFQSLHKQLEPH